MLEKALLVSPGFKFWSRRHTPSDHDQLNALLSDLLAADKPQQLLTAAELVLCLNTDDQTLANAQLHLAAALALTGQADAAPEHARTAARLDPKSVNRWVGVLAQQVTAHPELAAVIESLVTQPGGPGDASSPRSQDASP